jgi:multidrug efflux pump subunit AcrB
MLLLLGGGLFAASRLTVERTPHYDPRSITVAVPFRGATPAEVEADVTARIEEAVSGIVGVERVIATSSEGRSQVTLELKPFADAVDVLNATRAAVERIENFPPARADQPEIVRTEVIRSVLTFAVSSAALDEDGLRGAAEALRADLLALPSVSFVSLAGTRDREIQIELSEEALRRYRLSIDEVARRIRGSSVNATGGEVRTDAGDVVISTLQKRETAAEFRDIVLLARPDGTLVRTRDVATVRDGFEEDEITARIDGRPAVFVRVHAGAGQPPQEVAEEVKGLLDGYALRPGADVALWDDETRLIDFRLSRMSRNGLFGAVLVFVSLLLIFDLRMSLWIAVGIPVSFLGSFLLFDAFGLTINGLSLFGFFLVTGIVVDDAIVVGESIARQREQGLRGAAASIAGVRAVGGPVVVGGLTTMVAFAALLPLEGAVGQMFGVVPVAVILVLVFSLVEAFFVLPGHLAGDRRWSLSPLAGIQARTRRSFDALIQGRLVAAIARAVLSPFVVIAAVAGSVVLAVSLLVVEAVPINPFPASLGADRLAAEVTMPVGSPFRTTVAAAEQLAEAARAADEAAGGGQIESIAVLAGQRMPRQAMVGTRNYPKGTHLATVEVKFAPAPRPLNELDFLRLWRARVGEIRGAERVHFVTSADLFSPSVSYTLAHDDPETVAQAVAAFREAASEIDATREVQDSLGLGSRRYDFELNETGFMAGLTPRRLANQLRDAFFGAEAQRIQRGPDEIRVVVRYPAERRRSLRDLLDERISLGPGKEVPLSAVARITETQDYATLTRLDGRRAATVTAFYDPEIEDGLTVRRLVNRGVLPALAERHPGLEVQAAGSTRQSGRTARTLAWTFPLAMLLVFGLLASQMRNLAQPFLALAGLPMAAVGAVLGHFVLGYELTYVSLFGLVAVSGVVVNDTLILMDRYNGMRRTYPDLPVIAAISAAARERARPIVITSATTIVGLLPLLYDKNETVQFTVPMVISLTSGLAFASIGLLFFIPAVLIVAEMLKLDRAGTG